MLPERNIWFDQLPPYPHIEVRRCGSNSVFIYVDDDGVSYIVCVDGIDRVSQQKQLDEWAKQ